MSADLEPIRARLLAQPDFVPALRALDAELRAVFGAERLTVYEADAQGSVLKALVATGLEGYEGFTIPFDATSCIAGYAGAHRRVVNIADAYDEGERSAFQPPLRFLDMMDRRSGFRTREVLAAPIADPENGTVYGVLQVLNSHDRRRFPAHCEDAARALCSLLAQAFRQREPEPGTARALAADGQTAARLRQQAEPAMRENAPESAALAREKLLQMYRDRFARDRRLDIEGKDARGGVGAPGDIEGLSWLCGLDAAGHCGAARLLSRVLKERYGSHFPQAATVHELGRRFPRIARYIARDIVQRSQFDVREAERWLMLAGDPYALIATALREAFGDGVRHGEEYGIVRHHVERAEKVGESGAPAPAWPQDLLADIALHRMSRASAENKPAAQRLLERAAELGSTIAREELWLQQHAAAADKVAFMRDWLAANPRPRKIGRMQARMIGNALERGELGAPPDPEAALPWYAAGLQFEPAAPDACFHVGEAFAGPWRDKAAAVAWYERGIERGEVRSLSRWLRASYIGEFGLARDSAAALERARRAIANGAAPGTPELVGSVRLFRTLEEPQWRELMDLAGYTPQMREDDAQPGRRRAREHLQMALELPRNDPNAREMLQVVLRDGDAEQRARAQQLLDEDGWPPLPPDDLAMYWQLFAKLEKDFATGEPIFKPTWCARFLALLASDPSARVDARLPQIRSMIARLNALLEQS